MMDRAPRWIYWVLPIIGIAVFLGMKLAYQPVLVSMVAVPLFVVLALLYRFRSPIDLVLVVTCVYAGTLGIMDSVPTIVPGLQAHDAITLGLLGTMSVLLLLTAKEQNVSLVRPTRLYVFFILWAIFRTYSTNNLFNAAKDLVFTLVFWTTLSLTRIYVSESYERAAQVRRWLLAGTFVCYAVHGTLITFGLSAWTTSGLATPTGKRPMALFLMIMLAVSLVEWLYPGAKRERRLGLICSIVSGLLILSTLSRTVIITIALVHVPLLILFRGTSRFMRPRVFSGLVVYAAAMVLLAFALLSLDVVQARFFYRSNPYGHEGLLSLNNLNTMGRENVWPVVWRHSLQRPFLGHGTGAVRDYVNALCRWEHPHCDYLRVFHDQGLVGLLLFCGFWLGEVVRLVRARKDTLRMHGDVRPTAVALTALMAVLLSFVTDNTMVYTYAALSLAMLLGASWVSTEETVAPRQTAHE